MVSRLSKPSKDAKEFKEEEEDLAFTSKSPPMLFKPLKPLKDAKEFKEEDPAITLKFPPISVRLFIPSYEVIPAFSVIKFPVIFFKLYNPSRLVRL